MNSRFQVLRTIGALSLILAWVLLILGVAGAIAGWVAMNGLSDSLSLPSGVSFLAVIPLLIFAISSFLQFFVIGKVLHLLVGLDETTLRIAQDIKRKPASDQPA